MTIRDRNKHFFEKYHHLLAPLLAVLAAYAGVDGYDKYQASQASAPVDVEVHVEAPAAPVGIPEHGMHLTRAQVQDLIDKAVKQALEAHQGSARYHEFD